MLLLETDDDDDDDDNRQATINRYSSHNSSLSSPSKIERMASLPSLMPSKITCDQIEYLIETLFIETLAIMNTSSKRTPSSGQCANNRFKRKCRSKGMNDQAIEMMLMKDQKVTRSIHQDNQQVHEKQSNNSSTLNIKSDINISMSSEKQDHSNQRHCLEENLLDDLTIQSSILQPSIITKEWSSVPVTTYPRRVKRYNLSNDHWKQVSKLIPNYNQLSHYQFKDLLIKAIPSGYHLQKTKIEKWLINFTKLQFIQQHAKLLSTLCQLKIEQNYWNYIANVTTMPTVIWLSKFSEDITKQNSINWDHTKTTMNIRRRRNIIENKLRQTEHNLNVHLKQQPYASDWQIQNKTLIDHIMKLISNALVTLIRNSLYYFSINFKQKKILLKFDINDVHLVKSFYDLNPTEEQIRSVQQIWRTKVKSCRRVIRQKKKHSSIIDRITTEEITQNHISLVNQSISLESFIPSMRTIIEARLVNIEQRAQKLMTFINTINDNNFF